MPRWLTRAEEAAAEDVIRREMVPAPEVVWAAIVCLGCSRRLYNDDGSPARSWRRWIWC